MIAAVINALAGWKGYAASALVGALMAGATAWTAQGWRYGAQIAETKAAQETARADANADAVRSLAADIQTISAAARRAADVAPQLTARVSTLSQALKNANPLPIGCRPDADRVRVLTNAVHATNDSTAR